eukprot:12425389-Karenia_brevis.AAC.1
MTVVAPMSNEMHGQWCVAQCDQLQPARRLGNEGPRDFFSFFRLLPPPLAVTQSSAASVIHQPRISHVIQLSSVIHQSIRHHMTPVTLSASMLTCT